MVCGRQSGISSLGKISNATERICYVSLRMVSKKQRKPQKIEKRKKYLHSIDLIQEDKNGILV